MALHVVVGAGPIGTGIASLLAEDGERVRLVTRSGSGPSHPAIERIAADAGDAARLRDLTAGAVALYNCANPPYHRWPTDWPPLASAMLSAAEATGAVLAITDNLYGYGPVRGPMTEGLPLAATGHKGRVRARMWRDALAAHEAGRVRVTAARAADFLGPGAASFFTMVAVPALAAGRTARIPAALDLPHSFSYTGDVARTLVTLARDERAWGRPWHVPSAPALTMRELAGRFCRRAGHPSPKLASVPRWTLRPVGLMSTQIREFVEVSYQFYAPFELDSSAVTRTFGLTATPIDEVLGTLVAARSPGVGR
jgi:nucleoside-diphosphate-sugar epimerase